MMKNDNYLKNEIASVGTSIGGGKHIKHEIMKYHRFFSQNILPNQRVLDVGCGNAFLAISVLKDVDCKITGVEICNSNFKLAKKNTKHTLINIGSGVEKSIKDFAKFIMRKMKVNLKIDFDLSKPNGTPRKKLNTSLARSYGWRPKIDLNEGFNYVFKDFLKNKIK